MNLQTKYMTQNDCYKANKKITPKGIMVHSTVAPGVMAAAWFDRWNKPNIEKCVHAFVDDKGVFQYLPWNHLAWHCRGKGNDMYISFEICEPSGFTYIGGVTMVGYNVQAQQGYFDAVWNNAVELCVMLCKQYNLDASTIICHSEGYKMGLASNHGDVMHWFPKHGKSMDLFRGAVHNALGGAVAPPVPPPAPQPAPVDRPVLRKGCKGAPVRDLQQLLIARGIKLPKYGADGDFGTETDTAVRTFQRTNGLVIDGVCGPKTWAALGV